MMSVNEFFYGNQPTPTQTVSASPTQQAKQQQQQQAPYGMWSPFPHEHEHGAPQQAPYSSPKSNPSSLNASYASKHDQQDPQKLRVETSYTSSAYISSSARDNASATFEQDIRRSKFSTELSTPSYSRHGSSRGGNSKPISTWVELRVPICCEACVERVNSHLLDLEGVESVTCYQKKQRVVVKGTTAARDVLKVCKKLFKRSEYWRYEYDWL